MELNLREKMFDDLKTLVRIPSVSSELDQVEKALDAFLKMAADMGFHTEKLVDGQIGVIEMGEGDETLGILVHLDVVDIGDPAQWTVEPFDVTIKDDKIFGRGTLDDKGGAVASLYAMKAVMEGEKPLNKKVRMIVGTQEEVEWVDMYAYVEQYELPDYAFTPDGKFPIGNVEKGYYTFDLKFPYMDEDKEEGELPVITSIDCGIAANVVPERCTIELSDGQSFTAEGKAAHTCLPDRGVNALFVMKEMLEEKGVKLGNNTCKKVMNMLYDYFSDFVGKKLGIEEKDEYYMGEFIHKNMYTPSVIKTTEDGIDVVVNARFAWTTSKEEIQNAFKNMCEKYGGEIVAEDFLPAVFVSRNAPYIKQLAKAYEDVTGTEAEFVIDYSASYCKAMPNMVSFGPIFPWSEDMCHQTDEYIPLKDFKMMYDILVKSIEGIACSEESMKPEEV